MHALFNSKYGAIMISTNRVFVIFVPFWSPLNSFQNGTKIMKIRLVLITMATSKVFWIKKRMQENPGMILPEKVAMNYYSVWPLLPKSICPMPPLRVSTDVWRILQIAYTVLLGLRWCLKAPFKGPSKRFRMVLKSPKSEKYCTSKTHMIILHLHTHAFFLYNAKYWSFLLYLSRKKNVEKR